MARALLREDRRRSGTNNVIIEEDESGSAIEGVSQRVSELVESCTLNKQQSSIQLNVFQVVSSIRSVLTEANIVNKESPILRMYPELARQRKVVLSALSRLVLKGKELQQQDANDDDDQVSHLADQLLSEMEIFEKLLAVTTRQSSYSLTDSDYTTRPSSMFHNDTPRSSISSLGHSSVISTNSTSLRQIISEARHNSNSLIKSVPTDADQILQNILDHQASIDELMGSLVITLGRYLVNRHRATEMLETTRKAVEAVRTFLAIVEHVCSNLGDLDYNRRISMIPEDPRLVSLVLTKESVYSAITNLVTAVRALTGPQQEDEKEQSHLPICCENVVQTTNECAACIRDCIQAEETEEDDNKNQIMRHNMQQQQQHENGRSQHTLSILGRKVTSLHALQQYRDEIGIEKEEKVGDTEHDIEGLAIATTTSISTNSENALIDNATDKTTISPPQVNTSEDIKEDIKEDSPRPNILRARAASVNNIQNLISQNQQLPPLPTIKHSVSAAFPLAPNGTEPFSTPNRDAPLRSRRSRGLSVSSLRPSINKSKLERIVTSISTDSLPEPLIRNQKLSSWRSIGSFQDKTEAIKPSKPEPIVINPIAKVNYKNLQQIDIMILMCNNRRNPNLNF